MVISNTINGMNIMIIKTPLIPYTAFSLKITGIISARFKII